ncbi:hypothetical protein J2W40_001326 [Sphingobium xenophagum]|uniref:Uncharacterized protein n=1 Tax=Sphingobium xenophagum TaxID=121428 RepID=A0ABU1WZA5_SPHXE|nr:hypothetical protein [Sphingobium xenophagum]MDR7154514.1 hypothetical protein [Sphingobium xenophagum]
MIDDDFSPDRIQLRALGHLLISAQNSPLFPSVRESALYSRVYGRDVSVERRAWLVELRDHGLVVMQSDDFRAGDLVGEMPVNICLTPAGTHYIVSRAPYFAENARTPTDDFPDEIVDAPWAIQSYFSPRAAEMAPAADRFIRFDHNKAAFDAALKSLDDVYQALKSDNEIGSSQPDIRDEKLEQLKLIRLSLERGEGWQTKLISAGWGVLGYLATSFADRPVGHLAEVAWQALQVAIGIR